ncbi:MAG TPA: response regulator [Ktedonobacterales bacterium]|nr:response regulator [Ktedonobacterales bacterium]
MIVSPHQKSPTILLIENDPANRFLAERVLALSGYQYLSVANGAEALQLLDQQHVDLVLTDLSMPMVDGFGVAEKIRERPQFSETPIIALTAHTLEQQQQRALQAGCTAIVTKPYRPKQLIDMIARHLAT